MRITATEFIDINYTMHIIALRCVHHWTDRGTTNDREKKWKCKYRTSLLSQMYAEQKKKWNIKILQTFGQFTWGSANLW